MFKTTIIANKCLWLKTRPLFTLRLTEEKKEYVDTYDLRIKDV